MNMQTQESVFPSHPDYQLYSLQLPSSSCTLFFSLHLITKSAAVNSTAQSGVIITYRLDEVCFTTLATI